MSIPCVYRVPADVPALLLVIPFSLPPLLLELIKEFVWHEPRHIVALFLCYHVALVTDWIILHRAGRLSLPVLLRTGGRYMGNTFGALALLMVATSLKMTTPYLFWISDLSMAVLGVAVFMVCAKNLSYLGVISKSFYQLLESKVNSKLDQKIDEHSPGGEEENEQN